MAVTLQQGQSATILLKFLNADSSVALPPTSGGSVHADTGTDTSVHLFGTVTLAADQKTVTYQALNLGVDTVTYNGPNGLTATLTVNVVATTATSVVFDETTWTVL